MHARIAAAPLDLGKFDLGKFDLGKFDLSKFGLVDLASSLCTAIKQAATLPARPESPCSSGVARISRTSARLETLDQRARAQVAATRADPSERLGTLRRVYDELGVSRSPDEDFLRWMLDRGVLRPLDGTPRSGSRWWWAVNDEVFYWTVLAHAWWVAGVRPHDGEPVAQLWASYLDTRTHDCWYSAHTSAVLRGCAHNLELLSAESDEERVLIDEVLERLLFSWAMAQGKILGRLGESLTHPQARLVELLTAHTDLYPRAHPAPPPDHRGLYPSGPAKLRVQRGASTVLLHAYQALWACSRRESVREAARELGQPELLRSRRASLLAWEPVAEPQTR